MIIPEAFTLVLLLASFVIVFACCIAALRNQAFFGETSTTVVALCVAALSILGLLSLTSEQGAERGSNAVHVSPQVVDVLLLPYAALAITIIVVLLLKILGIGCKRKHEHLPIESDGSHDHACCDPAGHDGRSIQETEGRDAQVDRE